MDIFIHFYYLHKKSGFLKKKFWTKISNLNFFNLFCIEKMEKISRKKSKEISIWIFLGIFSDGHSCTKNKKKYVSKKYPEKYLEKKSRFFWLFLDGCSNYFCRKWKLSKQLFFPCKFTQISSILFSPCFIFLFFLFYV